jgi:hypothetical protein
MQMSVTVGCVEIIRSIILCIGDIAVGFVVLRRNGECFIFLFVIVKVKLCFIIGWTILYKLKSKTNTWMAIIQHVEWI